MPAASMKQLLESGVHFGHQTRRWNPKMKPYIFSERGGIHIIDLQQTTVMLDRAYDFVRNIASRGGSVLFVGTKKQCQEVISEEAGRVGMPYVSHRWLGGLLTNYATIDNRIKRMHELRKLKEEGQLGLLPTKERMAMERELEKLEINLGGVSIMTRLPDAVFVADPKREAIATKEVFKLGLPLIGLCDTNCDPDDIEYLIPGNDDAIRSCGLIVKTLCRAVEEGRAKIQVADFLAAETGRAGEQGQPSGHGAGEGDPRQARGSRGAGGPGGDDRSRGARRPGGDSRSGAGGRPSAGSSYGGGGSRTTRPESGARPAPARRMPQAPAGAARVAKPMAEAVAEPEAVATEAVTDVAEVLTGGEALVAEAPVVETPAVVAETEAPKVDAAAGADPEA
jgi:small subunit ribosomal protein S2